MPVAAVAAVGVGVGIYGAVTSGAAREEAAEGVERAGTKSARFLLRQGELAEKDIRESTQEALGMSNRVAWDAAVPLAPFKEAGLGAFESVEDRIMGGDPRLIAPISEAATAAVTGRPEIFDLSGPVGAEVGRQGELAAYGAAPGFEAGQMGLARTGVKAAGDLAGIEMRSRNRMAQLLQASGAQRSSALIGQTAPISDLILGGQQAALLGDVAGRNTRTAIIEDLVKLGGELY